MNVRPVIPPPKVSTLIKQGVITEHRESTIYDSMIGMPEIFFFAFIFVCTVKLIYDLESKLK